MRSAKALREDLDALRDELQAIVAVAEKENRELSAEENERTEELTETLIPALNAAIERRMKIDAEMKANATARLASRLQDQEDKADNTADRESGSAAWESFRVPAQAKSRKSLQAFGGENAERDAYISGRAIMAGIYNHGPSIDWCKRHGLWNTMIESGSGGAGGFLVPDVMENTLVRLREEYSVFERYARPYPMASDNVSIPRLLTDVTSYWVGEAADITASDATIGQAKVVAQKLGCLTKVSTELDEDAVVMIGDEIVRSMAYSMAVKIDEAGFNGDGTSTYGGIVGLQNALTDADPSAGGAGAIVIAATGNTGAVTLDLVDFEDVVGQFPAYPGAQPRWFMSKPVFWASAARLVDAAGGNTNGTLSSGPNETTFLGYPVTFVQAMTKTTAASVSTIVAYFGDLRLAATMGTRRSVRTMVSTDRYFESDLIGIKCTQRIGITVHETGDTIRTRPILALETAAS